MSDAPEPQLGQPAPPRLLTLSASGEGVRLDLFLAAELELSRSQVRRLLERRAVSLDGRRLSLREKGMPLPPDGVLSVEAYRRPDEQRAIAEPRGAAGLRVVCQGPGWLAVDKPPGVAVHPLREDERGTVLNHVIALHPEIHGVGEGGLRSGVVHRLDVGTSGVMLVATEADAWRRLRGAFHAHRVSKTYHALVSGELAPAVGELELELPLLVARHRPAAVRVASEEEQGRGRARWVSQTIRPLEVLRGATLVEIRPRTGFLHQIRVTLAHLGHPVLGDRRYGEGAEALGAACGAGRHMLHAARVRFEEIEAEAPPPDDWLSCLEKLRS